SPQRRVEKATARERRLTQLHPVTLEGGSSHVNHGTDTSVTAERPRAIFAPNRTKEDHRETDGSRGWLHRLHMAGRGVPPGPSFALGHLRHVEARLGHRHAH